MNLRRLPSDPGVVVDLDKVSYVEAVEMGESGTVLFPIAEQVASLAVNVLAGWMVYLGLDGQEFRWSGTEHGSQAEALAEVSAVADTVGWSAVRVQPLSPPWIRKKMEFE